jgi:hypothetical protein
MTNHVKNIVTDLQKKNRYKKKWCGIRYCE